MDERERENFTNDIISFMQSMLKESDRALAILGAARLDFALENLLKKIMHHHPGGSDNLFSADRPLGTFSAKINLAFRLGLIDEDVEHAIQMVRKIRNDFAHSHIESDFFESRHRDRIREVVQKLQQQKRWKTLISVLTENQDTPRNQFCLALGVIIGLVEYSEKIVERIDVKHTVSFG